MPTIWQAMTGSSGTASATATASGLYNTIDSTTTAGSTQWLGLGSSATQMAMLANQTAACTQTGTTLWTAIWEDDVTRTQYYQAAQSRAVYYRERTAEEQRLLAERQAAARRVEAERRALYEEARSRSRELLLAHLTAAQRKTFADNRWFIVEGSRSRTRYRIRDAGHAGNIDVLHGERVTHRLCCHCSHAIPSYDNMLAQKITLEYDEDSFLRLANREAA